MERIRHSRKKILMAVIPAAILLLILLLQGAEMDDAYTQVYASFLESKEYEEDFNYPSEVRYELVYIDEDEIPELLLAEGNHHVDRMAVYYYDTKSKEVKFLASFSSFGSLSYMPKENVIISQYGNHGYYFEVYSAIQDGSVSLEDIFLSDGSGEEYKYYHGFSVPNDFTGGFGKAKEAVDTVNAIGEVDEQYEITEEAYNKMMEQVLAERVRVFYSEMEIADYK